MPITDELFLRIVQYGRSDAEVCINLLADVDGQIPFDRLAGLLEEGLIEGWEQPYWTIDENGKSIRMTRPVVVISSLSAEKLHLRLLPDSSRWVDRKEKIRPAKRSRKTRTTAETDLDDETETPLDERIDVRAREAIDVAAMYERIMDLRPILKTESQRREFDWMKPPEMVLMGVLPYPHPGTDRGPFAPHAIPGPEDLERNWQASYAGPCHCCKGLSIRFGTICEPCSSMSRRAVPANILEAAKAEVDSAWKEWTERRESILKIATRPEDYKPAVGERRKA